MVRWVSTLIAGFWAGVGFSFCLIAGPRSEWTAIAMLMMVTLHVVVYLARKSIVLLTTRRVAISRDKQSG